MAYPEYFIRFSLFRAVSGWKMWYLERDVERLVKGYFRGCRHTFPLPHCLSTCRGSTHRRLSWHQSLSHGAEQALTRESG